MKNFRKAFTLSEVLIAIGLVGVLSVFMLNIMSHKKPNQNKAMFRKAYYIVEREASAMAMDDDNFPTEIEGSKRLAYFDPSINPAQEGVGQFDDNGIIRRTRANTGKYFCKTFAEALNTVGEIYCYDHESDGNYTTHNFEEGGPTFVTNDNIYWYITPNIICDPTDPTEKATGQCTMGGINNINDVNSNDPECPTRVTDVRPFICVAFDVDGPEIDKHNVRAGVADPEMVSFEANPEFDVPYASRGYVYVYWNGKVKAPSGQTARYLKSVTVL